MEMVIEFILVYLLRYPGAVTRWIFSDRKRGIKELLKDDWYYNAGITGLVFAVPILIYIFFIKQ